MLLKEIKNPIFALNFLNYETIYRLFGAYAYA
jgi:hypothetical protein